MNEKLYTLVVNNVYFRNYFTRGKYRRFIVDFIIIDNNHKKLVLQLSEKYANEIINDGFTNLEIYSNINNR